MLFVEKCSNLYELMFHHCFTLLQVCFYLLYLSDFVAHVFHMISDKKINNLEFEKNIKNVKYEKMFIVLSLFINFIRSYFVEL